MKMSRMMPSRSEGNDSTPICRCRVLYMGSAVPHITKDGLQGIQEPLRELYPEQGALGARGIDSWLSVWSNGLLLENVDENHKKVTRFFPIETLHYCAAVRYVLVPEKASNNPSMPRFLPLDSPFARTPNPNHPPLFAAILRRTTGIKVLECHAFICKREMAANALVRCCFHAYADSSYAKQIDEKPSEYGTLAMRPDTDTLDRIEGWRQQNNGNGPNSGNPSGSMLTLNSHNGTHHQSGTDTLRSVDQMTIGDDMSIYNGDENHKVWAGMSVNENIYGEANYSSSTIRSGKTSRPRQAMPPAPPPPPPVKEDKGKKQDEKKRRKSASREDISQISNGGGMRHAHSVSNVNMSGRPGNVMRGIPPHHQHPHAHPQHPHHQPIYSNGTLMRPNGYPIMYVPTTATLPHPGSKKRIIQHAGTFSHRPKNAMKVAPHLIPVPPQQMMAMPSKKGKHYPQPIYTMEEPIYMPSARPLSPVASYQPGHFPHEAYLMQQYATMETGKKNKKGKKKNQPLAVPMPIPGPMGPPMMANGGMYIGVPPGPHLNGHQFGHPYGHGPPHAPPPLEIPVSPIQNGDDVEIGPSPENENEDESPFNTGIYRKKGHLNERAFSYSIRQEHRSRSYGSLANLKFATPIPNGNGGSAGVWGSGGPSAKEQGKGKERDVQQMMHELDLSGDELERSEVPRALYESKRLQAVNAHAASTSALAAAHANTSAKSHR